MTDHYELFGVDADASKDEIKAAYRAEVEAAEPSRRAELNRAWNVLSDPIQRQRYDEQRVTVASDDPDGGDAPVVVPARRTTGARRGPETTIVVPNDASGNGSGRNGSGNGRGGGGGGSGGGGGGGDDDDPDDVPMRGGRPIPQPTVDLPAGMHLAQKKQRGLAIALDLLLVIIIVVGTQYFVPRMVSSDFATNQDIISKQLDKADKAQDREDKANDRADNAAAAAKKAEKNDDTAAADEARDKQADAKADAKAAAADKKAAEKISDKASDETQTPLVIASGVAFILSLLLFVPISALTGQSLGKRLHKIWLVRIDGSKIGWGTAFAHYIPPLAIGIAIPQLGAVIALAMVFWSLRDRNGQGLHDKLAKTLVVDAPPAA